MKSDGTDQSFLPTLHLSVPEVISARTEFLLNEKTADGEERKNPGEAVGELIRVAQMAAAAMSPNGEFACIIPCNTFHASPIYDACVHASGGIRPVHLIKCAVDHIRQTFPKVQRVGVLCAPATRSLRLFHDLLEEHDYIVCEVSEEEQLELNDTIYNETQGIKAVGKTDWSTKRMETYAQTCVEQHGAQVIIMGCSEIPLVLQTCSVPLVDPLVSGARELIAATYPHKLKLN
jgi:aspartate racemase